MVVRLLSQQDTNVQHFLVSRLIRKKRWTQYWVLVHSVEIEEFYVKSTFGKSRVKNDPFRAPKLAKIDFTKNLSDRKIVEVLHCVMLTLITWMNFVCRWSLPKNSDSSLFHINSLIKIVFLILNPVCVSLLKN